MSKNRNEDKSVAAGGSDSLEFSYADRDRRISLRISGQAVLFLTSGLIAALAGCYLQLSRYGQLNVNGCGKLNPPGGQKC